MNISVGLLPRERTDEFSHMLSEDLEELVSSDNCALIAAASDGEPAGLLAAVFGNGVCRIASLLTAEPYRRKGVATALLDALVQNGGMLTGAVTCAYHAEELSAFFRRLGFIVNPGGEGAGVFQTSLRELTNIPFWAQEPRFSDDIAPFSKTNREQLQRYITRTMTLSGANLPPFAVRRADGDISQALTAAGEIRGLAVFSKQSGGEVTWLRCEKEFSGYLPDLLRAMYSAARNHIQPDEPIAIHAVNGASVRLTQKLCGNASFTPYYEAEAPVEKLRFSAQVRASVAAAMDGAAVPDWFRRYMGGA
jgi:GNAT superfamily N-acetyltransferase